MEKIDKRKIFVVNVMAISLDGKIAEYPEQADRDRVQSGFSSHEDRELVKAQIFDADAIIVGGSTLRASGKFWSTKNRWGRYPIWIVFSNNIQSVENLLLGQEEIPKILISKNRLESSSFLSKVEKISYGNANPGKFLLNHLSAKDYIKNIVLFGGGTINKIFYQEGLVDELKITISPFIFGSKGAPEFVAQGLPSKVRLCLKSSQVAGNHVFLTYGVQKS